jgi:hypothetical protein
VPFPQLDGDVVDKEFVAGNGQPVLGIEIREVREPSYEFVTQTRVGENFPVTVAFVALHERSDECLLDLHERSVAQDNGYPEAAT